jgi:hypothetical protein
MNGLAVMKEQIQQVIRTMAWEAWVDAGAMNECLKECVWWLVFGLWWMLFYKFEA